MGALPTFVGFSSTDIKYYWLMQAWKKNENINFDFRDCQLQDDVNSEDEGYIKAKCRNRILIASKFIQLIGEDTRYKYKYVRWEAEVAYFGRIRTLFPVTSGQHFGIIRTV